MLEKYEVTLRSKRLGNTWSMFWDTENFRDAEQLTLSLLQKQNMLDSDEIICIEKDYQWEIEK